MQETIRIRAAVLTASDSRTIEDDVSGSRAKMLLESIGAEAAEHRVISDDLDAIIAELIALSDRPDINLIITTGGTGIGPRDYTPEATLKVIERIAVGVCADVSRRIASGIPTTSLSITLSVASGV